MNWVLDLDGVVWLADEPIPGSAGAIRQLLGRGDDVVFVSNNSSMTVADYQEKLDRHGIDGDGRLVTSAMALATLVEPGERVLLVAGDGVREAIRARGAVEVDDRPDAVLVGFTRDFDYERMRVASTAVRDGARLLASNDDATYPTPHGPIPGAGSILAGIERASGERATIAGKPYPAICTLVRDRLGKDGMVVGDRVDTDGRFASTLGYRFALVLTGVTKRGDPLAAEADVVAPDLASLVAQK